MIITRFAPSPTGYLHVGGVRTSLYNFLFARKNQGKFILRIEDTDKSRSKKEYEDDIIENLKWLNLKWDEFYRQSERSKIYSDYLSKLINDGRAFYCYHVKSELDAERERLKSEGKPQVHWCDQKAISNRRILSHNNGIIRLAVEQGRVINFFDLIKGEILINTDTIGDFVIAKSFTEPLYNFAASVDDFEMNITHVIRGDEHVSNTPKQILILEALGLSAPIFAHLPLILGPDRSKLSKRHGATAIKEFRKAGYLPEAMLNFLALLGWHPSGDREFFTLDELKTQFSLERAQKSPAIFDLKKLNNLNSYYIKKLSDEEFFRLCFFHLKNEPEVDFKWIQNSGIDLNKIFMLEKERINTLYDIINKIGFAVKKELNYEKKLLFWKNQDENDIKDILLKIKGRLSALIKFDCQSIRSVLDNLSNGLNDKGRVYWPFRVALSASEKSPGPAEIAEALGKNETLRRVEVALKKL